MGISWKHAKQRKPVRIPGGGTGGTMALLIVAYIVWALHDHFGTAKFWMSIFAIIGSGLVCIILSIMVDFLAIRRAEAKHFEAHVGRALPGTWHFTDEGLAVRGVIRKWIIIGALGGFLLLSAISVTSILNEWI